ncbi:hypothetical protein Tco_1108167 [Tanacetum coccineum]
MNQLLPASTQNFGDIYKKIEGRNGSRCWSWRGCDLTDRRSDTKHGYKVYERFREYDKRVKIEGRIYSYELDDLSCYTVQGTEEIFSMKETMTDKENLSGLEGGGGSGVIDGGVVVWWQRLLPQNGGDDETKMVVRWRLWVERGRRDDGGGGVEHPLWWRRRWGRGDEVVAGVLGAAVAGVWPESGWKKEERHRKRNEIKGRRSGMEPYYLKCIKDGPFQPKTAQGDAKPESQWTPDEMRVIVQYQRLKSIIMSCPPDDIIESVISCVSAKETWTDLVHSFEGPSDTKENRIMDLKLKYQTFRSKSTKSLSQTYTRYKTLLNELANDGVNLSKHEINVGFVNSLPEKWITFSQGLRNANYTQTLDLANIYGRFVYEDNLIQRRYSDTRKALITTPSSTVISTAFFSNNVIQDFQENSDDEKDYKAEYKKMKAKKALLEISTSSSQNPKTFQPKNKGLVAETFYWDEEEVSDDEEITQVKVLMALDDEDLTVGKRHACNGEWVDITIRKCRDELLSLKQAKLDAVTFQIQNTNFTKLNHALQEQLKKEKNINLKWLTSSKKVSQCISEQIPHQKKKVLGGKLFTESSLKNENENLFIPASMGYDQEMVPKAKDWVKRLNLDSKLPNFNTGRILVPKSQAVNESLESTETSNAPESSKNSKAEPLLLYLP